jgi:chloramphenicol-sensitive protein RarD
MNKKGIWQAIFAYASWGVLPMYWKLLRGVPATQIIAHRAVWSFLTLVTFIFLLRKWPALRGAAVTMRYLRVYFVAALLIGANWLLFIWAVNAGFIIQTSLGYFINPLLSVVLGVVFFHERLRSLQWVCVGLTAAGVVFLTIVHGAIPWIALMLSATFGFYGLVKKKARLGSLEGLTLETGILLIPALGYILFSGATGAGAFLQNSPTTRILMAGAGIITVIPLLLFASASRRIPLSLLGILQYISPTLQFLIGVFVYKEPFSPIQSIGYGIVWLALIVFAVESIIARQVAGAIMAPE